MQTEGANDRSDRLSSKGASVVAAPLDEQSNLGSQRQKRRRRPVLVRNQKNPIAMGENLKLQQQRSLNRATTEQGSALGSLDHS